jgi:hypothetical protein
MPPRRAAQILAGSAGTGPTECYRARRWNPRPVRYRWSGSRPELLSQLTAVGKPPASALVLEIEEVYPHCPKSLLRGAAWKPDQWLPADAQPTSAEVTLAQLRRPGLTIADIEQAEVDMLKYRYE